jgi:SAM-dependent methyltransferase
MPLQTIKDIALALFTVTAAGTLITQCRKPRWLPGRLYLRIMNFSHSALTSWGLKHVAIGKDDTILDVGCGGGRTIHTLASIASGGKVYGIDYSPQSVAVSQQTNRDAISAGRVDVREASVSNLPFADGTFDLVTAVETHYYWPEPVSDLREILRVLKPSGRLLLIGEAYKRSDHDLIYPLAMKLVGGSCLSLNQQRELFSAAGYSEIEMFEDRRKGWFCGVDARPKASGAIANVPTSPVPSDADRESPPT